MPEETADHPGVIAFPPALFAGTLTLGLLLQFIFPATFLPRLLAIPSGVIVLVGAASIAISAFRAMGRAQTAVNPARPTTAIVSDGAFRFSRNPLYLSLTLLYIGMTLLFNALWALLLLVPLIVVVQTGVIEREEDYLEQKFGDEYLRYKASVRRWV
ncbi:MAG: isoprenylcysteine carboxylmethyltransferase family protein [Aphanocapsa sp. GSE-SYN-MK-11-07L]|jgi:protein-S-isoprenylcysteine O-methyltransferase Ste14|nr:isoprenylcysteine carboxylmethyltransferase family protein [Aphanocapsa sp. GSE-SYN-MK-11-07L]